jgi:hypothetical protein
MTTVMVADFSGMLPIRDPILLADNNAQLAENTWLYRGMVRGFRRTDPVYAIQYADTKSVYRIPKAGFDVEDFINSTWLEFPDPYMSVVRNPTVGDEWNRYYFFPSDQYNSTGVNPAWPTVSPGPVYNTLDRIIAGNPFYALGIPNPDIAPGVTPNPMPPTQVRHYIYSWIDNTGPPCVDNSVEGLTTGTWAIAVPPAITTADISTIVNFKIWRSVDVGGTLHYYCIDTQAINTSSFITFNDNYADATVVTFPMLTTYDAGLAQPLVPIGITPPTAPIQETRAYVYTYVSAYSEEGPPSPATVVDGQTTGTWVITMTCPTAAQMANRNLTTMRLYRTVTDATGNTAYYQVCEETITGPSAVVTYNDTQQDSDITANKTLDTVDYTAPPADLQGVVMMANGIGAGWSNQREVWFSAAYFLHAWPGAFALSVEYPIVGFTANGSSLNIITKGSPSLATGVTPDTMTMAKATADEPCLGRGSIIAAGEGAFYASPNGYQLLNTTGVANQTGTFIDKEFLYSLQPQNFAAGKYGTGIVSFIKGPGDGSENGFLIDTEVANTPFIYINTSTDIINNYVDELSGQIFYLTGGEVFQWNPPQGGTLYPYTWKSKKFRFTAPQQFKAFLVEFDLPPEITITPGVRNEAPDMTFDPTTQLLIVRIYGNDNQLVVREIQRSGEVLLIPGGSKWTFIEFQIEGQVDVHLFKIASSVKELKAA